MMRDVRPYARGYPMTLAETASTFGENVLMNGILDDPTVSDSAKSAHTRHRSRPWRGLPLGHPGALRIREGLLRRTSQWSAQRFALERTDGGKPSVGSSATCSKPGGEDPYFWASKLHFYITGITFYNFPYTFGYLLSRGLYAMFKPEGETFLPKYEEFLRRAGSDSAENVVQANRRSKYRGKRNSGAKRFGAWKNRLANCRALLAQSHDSTLVTRKCESNFQLIPSNSAVRSKSMALSVMRERS